MHYNVDVWKRAAVHYKWTRRFVIDTEVQLNELFCMFNPFTINHTHITSHELMFCVLKVWILFQDSHVFSCSFLCNEHQYEDPWKLLELYNSSYGLHQYIQVTLSFQPRLIWNVCNAKNNVKFTKNACKLDVHNNGLCKLSTFQESSIWFSWLETNVRLERKEKIHEKSATVPHALKKH